jgi:D-beta-D-heptose 7-phosphate kinase/D-beta-D-heptose 1-phosphate adenosyltransferase
MKIVLATGGFDPVHSGHIQYLKAAKELGDILIIGLNSDEWLERKKGKSFMPWNERLTIMNNLKMVDEVFTFIDDDDTAVNFIKQVRAHYPTDELIFVNGGDRTSANVPEMVIDDVEFAFGVGGFNKKNSSSSILEEWKSPKTIRNWGWYRVLDDKSGYKVKELIISPGQSLSMQRHRYRAEHWYILKGECTFNIINVSSDIEELGKFKENQTITIEKDKWHQACNTTTELCHILEVQYGDKCIEEDIVRMK